MSRPYSILTALPPEAYLKPEDFATCYDGGAGSVPEQHSKGVQISLAADVITISAGGTWGAREGNGSTSSYEGIGYHRGTADLLRGFLDGPAPIVVYRWGNLDGVQIKPRTCPRCGGPLAKGVTWFDGTDCPKRSVRAA